MSKLKLPICQIKVSEKLVQSMDKNPDLKLTSGPDDIGSILGCLNNPICNSLLMHLL